MCPNPPRDSLRPSRFHNGREAAFDPPEAVAQSTGLIGGGGGREVLAVEAAVGAHGDAVTLDHVRVEHLAFVGGQEPVLGASLAVRVLRVGVRRADVSGKEKEKKRLAEGFYFFFWPIGHLSFWEGGGDGRNEVSCDLGF